MRFDQRLSVELLVCAQESVQVLSSRVLEPRCCSLCAANIVSNRCLNKQVLKERKR